MTNLEWTTISGNTKHCFNTNMTFKQQVLNNAKRNKEINKKETVIKGHKFNSRKEAAEFFNVDPKTIYNWLHRGVV